MSPRPRPRSRQSRPKPEKEVSVKSTRLTLTTGFELEITPLPPYALDALQQKYRPVEFKRAVLLASGATEYLVYDSPGTPPSPGEGEEYDLWVRYQAHQRVEKEKAETYYRERAYFLLAKCVKVISGPSKLEDPDWVDLLEAFEIPLPTNPIRKRVLWLWQVVFGGNLELYTVTEKYAVIDNLTMTEVQAAVQGMNAVYDEEPLLNVVARLPGSLFGFDLRMTETEVCVEAGILPEQWYEMDKAARAQLVAGYLVPKWRETIQYLEDKAKPRS